MSHWIAAPLVLPLCVGALQLLLERHGPRVQRGVGLLAVAALLGINLHLLQLADGAGSLSYLVGNWPAEFGIALTLDRLSAALLCLCALLALICLLYASAGGDRGGAHFHALFQFQLLGLNGAFLTGDLFNLFVWFEVLLIASYGLLLHGAPRATLKAGMHYVVLNLAGSALFLVALALLFGVLGTLNMAHMATRIAELPASDVRLVHTAGWMLIVVFALKAAILPLSLWLPATYSQAPAAIAALFAIMTKVGVYAILRTQSLLFGSGAEGLQGFAGTLLASAGAIAVVVAGLGALAASTLKRLCAYLVLGSAASLVMLFALNQVQATAAALLYLLHSTLAAALLFLLADLCARARGSAGDSLRLTAAMAWPQRLGVLCFLAMLLLAALPPWSGFLAKLAMLQALLAVPGQGGLAAALLLGGSLNLLALMRAFSHLCWNRPEGEVRQTVEIRRREWGAAYALLALLVLLSVAVAPTARFGETTARAIHAATDSIPILLAPPEKARPEIVK